MRPTPWQDWAAAARADYEESLGRRPAPGPVDFGEVVAHLDRRLPPEAILTNGAGNFSLWPQRYYRFKRYGTQLGSQSGAMGYAIPAAVAAKLHVPEVPVVAFCGDGDFLMTAQELATAVQYEAPIVVVVINNGMLATIRMHQERTYPDRPSASDLLNPDFAAYARAFGGFGATIERTEEFPAGVRTGAGLRRAGSAGATGRPRSHAPPRHPQRDPPSGPTVIAPRRRSAGWNTGPWSLFRGLGRNGVGPPGLAGGRLNRVCRLSPRSRPSCRAPPTR